MTGGGLRRSPLEAAHAELGAKMVSFGGWSMPLSYPAGTIAEHMECRNRAAMFDVSHLGCIRLEGASALGTLQAELTNDLGRIGPGRAQYTHLLDPDDASVVDDIIIWWSGEERFEIIPNATNTSRVRAVVGGRDVTAERALVAVQGPEARQRLGEVSPAAAAVGRFCVERFQWRGSGCVAAGTGYTGEDGVECSLPVAVAGEFWASLLAAGVAPAGLGARDTLRLEVGLPLHGHELGPGITPLQAGLGWVVAWGKGPFRGRAALQAEREAGVSRRLVGLLAEGRRPPRASDAVTVQHREVGRVTSGNYSPVLRRGIGISLVEVASAEAEAVTVTGPGRTVPCAVVRPPFVSRSH